MREVLILGFVHPGKVEVHVDRENGETSHNRIGAVPMEIALIHELVAANHQIKDHDDPEIHFAVSSLRYSELIESRDMIGDILNLSSDQEERAREILKLEQELPSDLPYWKSIDRSELMLVD